MFAVVLFALLFACALFILVGLFGKNPTVARTEREARERPVDRPRIAPERLRALVTELLDAMGATIVDDPPPSPATAASQRFSAVRKEAFDETYYIVFLEAAPPGDVVDQPTLLELAEQAKYEPGSLGLLVTPYAIERAGVVGLDRVHLIDGARLRELVAEHLPHRRAELARYHLTGDPVRGHVTPAGEGASSHESMMGGGRGAASHART